MIAVIGCDGSGKSTLTNDLLEHYIKEQKTELIYLGQSSGSIGNWITSLPIIGKPLGSYLKSKAKKAHGKEKKSPDIATVVVIYCLSLWRLHKFRKMLAKANSGTFIITDRYPQSQVSGFYFDGTGLGVLNEQSWLIKKLAAREQRLYQQMASYIPTLLIRLNIDAKTAYDRKPDHKFKMLEEKVRVTPTLDFNGADILELDAKASYEQVLATALNVINQKALNH